MYGDAEQIRPQMAATDVLTLEWILTMRCPYCQHHDSKVLDTSHDSHGGIRRRRECFKCGQRFSTYERPILATPLIVKQDGTREEFGATCKVEMWAGDVFVIQTPGGGGYGSPA